VWYSATDAWAGEEQKVGEIGKFAVRCTLHTALTESATGVEITLGAIPDFDFSEGFSDAQKADDHALLYCEGEWLSLGTISTGGEGWLAFAASRGRIGSTAAAHDIDVECYIVLRSHLPRYSHADFAGAPVTGYFRLVPMNAWESGDSTATKSVTFRDPEPSFAWNSPTVTSQVVQGTYYVGDEIEFNVTVTAGSRKIREFYAVLFYSDDDDPETHPTSEDSGMLVADQKIFAAPVASFTRKFRIKPPTVGWHAVVLYAIDERQKSYMTTDHAWLWAFRATAPADVSVTMSGLVAQVTWTWPARSDWVGIEWYWYVPNDYAGAAVNTTTNTITHSSHGFDDGTRLICKGPTPPAPLEDGVIYYVVNKTANDYQLALTSGGDAIDLTTTGTAFGLHEFDQGETAMVPNDGRPGYKEIVMPRTGYYYFRLWNWSFGQWSVVSDGDWAYYTGPATPTNIDADVSSWKVTFSWTATADPHDFTIVEFWIDGASEKETIFCAENVTSVARVMTAPGDYKYRIRAYDKFQQLGPWSATGDFEISTLPVCTDIDINYYSSPAIWVIDYTPPDPIDEIAQIIFFRKRGAADYSPMNIEFPTIDSISIASGGWLQDEDYVKILSVAYNGQRAWSDAVQALV